MKKLMFLFLIIFCTFVYAENICPKCEHRNPKGDRYCINCAAKIDSGGIIRKADRALKKASIPKHDFLKLKARGYITYEGKKLNCQSSAAIWWKNTKKLFIYVFPFKLTKEEEAEILKGDKGELLLNEKIQTRKPPSSSWKSVPYLLLSIQFKPGEQNLTDKTMTGYDMTFCSFEGKTANTGTGEWVKDFTKNFTFEYKKTPTWRNLEFTFQSKADSPHNWDINISGNTQIYKIEES